MPQFSFDILPSIYTVQFTEAYLKGLQWYASPPVLLSGFTGEKVDCKSSKSQNNILTVKSGLSTLRKHHLKMIEILRLGTDFHQII